MGKLEWDKELHDALLNDEIVHAGKHTAQIGHKVVWISNWPYAYGSNHYAANEKLPSAITRYRLKRKIEEYRNASSKTHSS